MSQHLKDEWTLKKTSSVSGTFGVNHYDDDEARLHPTRNGELLIFHEARNALP